MKPLPFKLEKLAIRLKKLKVVTIPVSRELYDLAKKHDFTMIDRLYVPGPVEDGE